MANEDILGPWELARDAVPPGYTQITVMSDDGHRIATVFHAKAARLIRATPDLLAALQLFVASRADDDEWAPTVAARAAIAKATEEE